MAYWILISCALACELPHLPPSIDYFSPNYLANGHLEASGRFIASSIFWPIEISKPSWIRLIAEPKNHALEILLTHDSTEIFASKSPDLGAASFAGKLEPGTYRLELIIDSTNSESEGNTIDCELPNLYLSIGITPYINMQQYKSKKYPSAFPDISEVNESLKDSVPYSSTYDSSSLSPNQISGPILISYPIKVPKIALELLNFGFTGLWELTFALRNY